MKCDNCGKELTEQFAFCPFCGKTIVNEPVEQLKEITMETVLKKIVNEHGANIVLNSKRCTSLFMDLAPGLKDELQFLKVALQVCNIGSFFINCAKEDRKMNIRKAINAMERMVTEEAQKEIVSSFVYAYGWDDIELKEFFREETISSPMVKPEEKKEEKNSQENLDTKVDAEQLYQEGKKHYNAKEYAKAADCYRKAAEQGYATAQNDLGWMYQNGHGVGQDYAEAARWYRKAAEQGQARAQFNLGRMYYSGCGVAQNDAETVKWFRKAADQGLADAQKSLGVLYWDGYGVGQDYAEAARWYRKAAEQGDVDAQSILGWTYENAHGVGQDYAEAARWYRKAAEQGDAEAQSNLGWLYYNGQGVVQNDAEAFKWTSEASKQGNVNAQNNLGLMYMEGRGTVRNYDNAMVLFQKADAQGNVYAPYNLGRMYENGWGVTRDIKVAKQWYERAAARGHTDAKKKVEELNKKGCFITTAVCGSLNKPDDCDELTTMRWYRDKLKAEDAEMAVLIEEYYRVAPLIVQKINNSSEAESVYRKLWEDSISKIYHNVKQKQYRQAKLQYMDMLEELSARYHVPFAQGIYAAIKKVRARKN